MKLKIIFALCAFTLLSNSYGMERPNLSKEDSKKLYQKYVAERDRALMRPQLAAAARSDSDNKKKGK
jgi:hypothetical protein